MFLVKCICLFQSTVFYCWILQKMLLIVQKYMFIQLQILQMLPSNFSYLLQMSGYTRWHQWAPSHPGSPNPGSTPTCHSANCNTNTQQVRSAAQAKKKVVRFYASCRTSQQSVQREDRLALHLCGLQIKIFFPPLTGSKSAVTNVIIAGFTTISSSQQICSFHCFFSSESLAETRRNIFKV